MALNYEKCSTISDVVSSGNCTSCGLCVNNNLGTMEMKKEFTFLFPDPTKEKDKELLKICPGRGYDIVDLGKKRFTETSYDYNWVITKASVLIDLMIRN